VSTNPILVLVGLLVLSYAGSLFAGGRTIRGAGLPSSVEYVALGFALGPHALGLLGRDLVTTFEPLAEVAIGWLALLIGLDFGRSGERSARPLAMLVGILSGTLTGGAVAAAVWFFVTRVRPLPPDVNPIVLAGGIGAACAETTRHAIRWAVERHGASGKLTTLLGEFAHADDLGPLVGLALLYALTPVTPVTLARFHLTTGAWVGITFGFGIILGAMTALHIRSEPRTDETWGVLLGMSMLGIGVAARLELSMLTVLFAMGLTTAALSRHRAGLREMVSSIERPILLPALVLAGAHLDFRALPGLGLVVAVAVVARIAVKLLVGLLVGLPLSASPLLGVGLLSSGALSMCVGLAYALRFPGPVGDTVLAAAAVTCVVGELVGPLALRRVLRGAGEIQEPLAPPSAQPEAG